MDKQYLKNIFEKYKICITESQILKFEQYFDALIETNKFLNLTAITDEKEVVIKHFLDSVLPEKDFPKKAKVIDVGSGAGFPGIPLKIVRDDLEICMVDSLGKRVNFLNDTTKNLNLEKIVAVHARAEDFAKENREKFDVATARAVAPLCTLTEYLLPFVKVGGVAIIYKSTKLDEELSSAQKAIKTLGGKVETVRNFKIDEFDLERNILILKKVSATPSKFPRSGNKPKTNPIA